VTEKEQQSIFESWLKDHKALVFKVVRAYAPTAMDQEDLFQEIMIQVWRSVPSFRGESSVTTWLYRISLNIAIKWTKKEKRYYRDESIIGVEHILLENDLRRDERLEWLYQQIYQLDEIDRSITLLLLDGFAYKEMAVMLGISETNVGVKINRIKKLLITKSKNYERV
jgi:RNA polymerase sigma-70 factor (ECF subfamily)